MIVYAVVVRAMSTFKFSSISSTTKTTTSENGAKKTGGIYIDGWHNYGLF
jgi:hypothetical protein